MHAPLVPEGVRSSHQHDDARVQGGLLGGQAEGRVGRSAGHFLMMSMLLCSYDDIILSNV